MQHNDTQKGHTLMAVLLISWIAPFRTPLPTKYAPHCIDDLQRDRNSHLALRNGGAEMRCTWKPQGLGQLHAGDAQDSRADGRDHRRWVGGERHSRVQQVLVQAAAHASRVGRRVHRPGAVAAGRTGRAARRAAGLGGGRSQIRRRDWRIWRRRAYSERGLKAVP